MKEVKEGAGVITQTFPPTLTWTPSVENEKFKGLEIVMATVDPLRVWEVTTGSGGKNVYPQLP